MLYYMTVSFSKREFCPILCPTYSAKVGLKKTSPKLSTAHSCCLMRSRSASRLPKVICVKRNCALSPKLRKRNSACSNGKSASTSPWSLLWPRASAGSVSDAAPYTSAGEKKALSAAKRQKQLLYHGNGSGFPSFPVSKDRFFALRPRYGCVN